MVDTTWAAVNVRKSDLIRKTLTGGAAFIAPYATTAIDNLTGTSLTGTLQALPAGYLPLGWMSEDGAAFARAIESSDVNAWGAKEPVRRDNKSDVSTCKITLLETNKLSMSLYLGTALTALTADANSGEVVTDKPDDPPTISYRLLVIGRDTNADGDFYLGRFFPRAQVTDREEITNGAGDDPVKYGLTFQAFFDTAENTAERYLWAGPGFKAAKTAMGF